MLFDHPVVPVDPNKEMTAAELQEALVGLHTDISDYVEGGEGLRVWDLRNDNTFTAYGMEVNKVLTPMATLGVDIMNKVDKNRPVSSIIITTMRIILTICQKKTQNV